MVSGFARKVAGGLRFLADRLDQIASRWDSDDREPQDLPGVRPPFHTNPQSMALSQAHVLDAEKVSLSEERIPDSRTGLKSVGSSSVPLFTTLDILPEREIQERIHGPRRYPDHDPSWNDFEFRERLKQERHRGLTPHEQSLITVQPPRTWLRFGAIHLFEFVGMLSQSMILWFVCLTLLVGLTMVYFVHVIVTEWLTTIELLENS